MYQPLALLLDIFYGAPSWLLALLPARDLNVRPDAESKEPLEPGERYYNVSPISYETPWELSEDEDSSWSCGTDTTMVTDCEPLGGDSGYSEDEGMPPVLVLTTGLSVLFRRLTPVRRPAVFQTALYLLLNIPAKYTP